MEAKRSWRGSLLLWAAVTVMVSQNLIIPVISSPNFETQKNYYSPDPSSPTVPHLPPPHGSGGGHATPTPFHGTPPSHGGGGRHGGTPSSHGRGGGSYGGPPPANCGNPPSGGGHHHTFPTPPTGVYYHAPPTLTPFTPTTPTPTVPSLPPPIIFNTPPIIVSPPTTPIIDPGTPSPPLIPFDPNSPPFTCTYWRNHPTLIWGLFGWRGTTVGSAFGLPGVGSNMNILQALSNTRLDGLGQLYREGTAALLNSMAHTRFPYTTSQVRDSFVAALRSNKAAAAQARLFKLANEGKAKPRA